MAIVRRKYGLDETVKSTRTVKEELYILENLDEIELCKLFGLDPETLQDQFGEIFGDILKVFNFFNSEKIPDKIADPNQIPDPAQFPDFQDMTATCQNTSANMSAVNYQTESDPARIPDNKQKIPDKKTIIRLLIFLYNKLSSGLAFSKNSLITLPF